MPRKTLRDRYLTALGKYGYTEVSRTNKRIKLSKPGVDSFIYLGKAGSVRQGKTSARSYPLSEHFKGQLLKEA